MSEKIMIIDDEIDIIFLLRDFFTLNDYEVITALNAQEATEKLSEKPDLILLDGGMTHVGAVKEVLKKMNIWMKI